jgi:hypothetical protein
MAKVFILNRNTEKCDYSAAAQYGEVIAVTEGMQPIFKTDQLIKSVKEVLSTFSNGDYIILTGPSSLVAAAAVYVFAKYDIVNILVHDAQINNYVLKPMDYNDIIF